LYINIDGAYALSSADGTVLWHKDLGSRPSVAFTPSVVVDGVVYLASIDGHGRRTWAEHSVRAQRQQRS